MGRVYLVPLEELQAVPQFAEMGPDVLTPRSRKRSSASACASTAA